MLQQLFSFQSFRSGNEKDTNKIPVPKLQLKAKIEAAIEREQHFYIGVACARGTPLQSLCHRERFACKPNATRCDQAGNHHADERSEGSFGLRLAKVFYTNSLILKNEVCKIEKQFITKYKEHDLCLNERSGQDNCIKTAKGIIYVRTYDRP